MKKVLTVLLALALVMGLMVGNVGAVTPAPNWDVSGTWDLNYNGALGIRQFVDLVQYEDGLVEGTFLYRNNITDGWSVGGSLVGYVSGNNIQLHYTRPTSSYNGDFAGTITKEGMSGRFTDSSGNDFPWSAEGSPRLLYEARITGGGQLRNESGVLDNKDRDINNKISFGLGAYIVNGVYWLDGAEVTFHNVSNDNIDKGTFVAESILEMNFYLDGSVANCRVTGTFNEASGYSMWIRAQDVGEPGAVESEYCDNIRFTLYKNGVGTVYDSWPSDFPGESDFQGTARHFLAKGNLQVEDLR